MREAVIHGSCEGDQDVLANPEDENYSEFKFEFVPSLVKETSLEKPMLKGLREAQDPRIKTLKKNTGIIELPKYTELIRHNAKEGSHLLMVIAWMLSIIFYAFRHTKKYWALNDSFARKYA